MEYRVIKYPTMEILKPKLFILLKHQLLRLRISFIIDGLRKKKFLPFNYSKIAILKFIKIKN